MGSRERADCGEGIRIESCIDGGIDWYDPSRRRIVGFHKGVRIEAGEEQVTALLSGPLRYIVEM